MRAWYRGGVLAWLLWPASLAFRSVVFLRRLLYRLRLLRSTRVDVPVVVIGNLVVGGSGKTPLVLWVAEHLVRAGWSPAIVSRGYGGRGEAPRAVTLAAEAAEVGDEPILLARRSGCPVWVGRDRARVIEALRIEHPAVNVIVLDDGLQHYRLRRDIEIAVVDARAFGNGFLLPAGPLREPPARLRAVGAVIAHGADKQRLASIAPRVPLFAMRLDGETLHRMTDARERQPLEAFAGERLHAVAAIGDPSRFFLALERAGAQVQPHPFPDHHPLTAKDLAFGDALPVVMTEKDAVKLRRAAQPNWWVLPVHAALEPGFGEWLLARLKALKNP
ncbi:MAG TPA: tetraacyldisaccharide 4'-kinase [Burkholderiales bacterium]|nr:tetraacyldisaccharide 4'-kinase [Burkholderiales bacterium]